MEEYLHFLEKHKISSSLWNSCLQPTEPILSKHQIVYNTIFNILNKNSFEQINGIELLTFTCNITQKVVVTGTTSLSGTRAFQLRVIGLFHSC